MAAMAIGNAAGGHAVSDKERERKALRTIAVSGRAAQRHATTSESQDRLRERTDELLAGLEDEVRRDGADPDVLDDIDDERRRLEN
jgi:hypothetical protein